MLKSLSTISDLHSITCFSFSLHTGHTRYSIETHFIMDTSHYPKVEYNYSLGDHFLTIVSKTFDTPKQFVSFDKPDNEWEYYRSEDDQIVVHLLAKDEETRNKILDLIHSTSFVSNMNVEVNKIEELAEGKVALKSNSEPVVNILTGI